MVHLDLGEIEVSSLRCKSLDSKKIFIFVACVGLMVFGGSIYASSITLGNMASSITDSFRSLTKMVTGGCYIAGLAFSVTAILQFKQHKDNPTQVTIGKPIALVFIAAALLFMPSVLSVAGYTMFGTSGGTVAGSTGMEFSGKV